MKKYSIDITVTVKPEGSYSWSDTETQTLSVTPISLGPMGEIRGAIGGSVSSLLRQIICDLYEKEGLVELGTQSGQAEPD